MDIGLPGEFFPALGITALNSRNEQNVYVRIKFSDQHVALIRNVCREPALGYFQFEFLLDFFQTLWVNDFRVPFRQCSISPSTNHSKLPDCHRGLLVKI